MIEEHGFAKVALESLPAEIDSLSERLLCTHLRR
jgi:hypothetical protein